MDSEPRSIDVALDGNLIGKTPLTITPRLSNKGHVVTLFPAGASPYVFALSEDGGDRTKTLFYSSSADATGRIVLDSQSAGSAVKRMPGFVKREAQSANVGLYVTTSDPDGASALRRMQFDLHVPSGSPIEKLTTRLGGTTYYLPGVRASERDVESLFRAGAMRVDRPQPRYLSAQRARRASGFSVTDSHYNAVDQWDLFAVQAPLAWSITQGSKSISVAVVDTGADLKSKDLSGKVVHAESISKGVAVVDPSRMHDNDGHGTNVAGIAAGATNNGFGYANIAFETSLQAYRIFDPANGGSASSADEAIAIRHAVLNGARVINLSFGSAQVAGPDPVEEAVIEDAINAGVVVVAAAGNEAQPSLDYPAAYAGVVSVGASAYANPSANSPIGARETIASYSNSSPALTLVAPGGDPTDELDSDPIHWIQNIYSSEVPNSPCDPSDCRAELAGTSQATPHVSGAVALMLSVNATLQPAQVTAILRATADDLGDSRQGAGRLNVMRAVAAAANLPAANALVAPTNAVVFAYGSGATVAPKILNTYYVNGVPVDSTGSFRMADIPRGVASYRIGAWIDSNGNGLVDKGDWFGDFGPCPATACARPTIVLKIIR